MRWHHFLCCLPLRLGVVIITALTFLGSALVAAGGWINVKDIMNHSLVLSKSHEIMVWVTAALYTFIVLISLFGLIGALTARVKLVAAFNGMQFGSFIASLVLGVIALIQLYSNKYDNQASTDCTNSFEGDLSAQDAVSVCRTALNVSKAAITAIYALIWLIQFYGLFIVHSYVQELRERKYPAVKYTVVKV
ncbi:uncharacterized protein EV420DRAFT_1539372 [Desarmillaria tabescens]|uniref:Uncharacterized protein n=1 Tax=Armillaria tabescens TaxID=1929756 RepID=A0AA39KDR0_ARMTA|nr:uncharacterized protein EV420DRAFT_1539372 [Desarmillaria tabescens]KAK0459291.1 hypothetical protein EV420DRAFT_1539372 [Desarmillaria tabescens]